MDNNKYQILMDQLSEYENKQVTEDDLRNVEKLNHDIIEFIKLENVEPEYIKIISQKIYSVIANLNYQKTELSKRITDSTYNKNAFKNYITNSTLLDGNSSSN
ncbi:MAG: hypothetical protein J0G32_04935 [Alphaproteobacteria bacterium]|nr:hypothetical protein [Alphaproteobacteria bacterium]OJV15793.1 MAG: hypothetical protein BGO27_07760 [Alphaproteobacteria bacterium 33-17]